MLQLAPPTPTVLIALGSNLGDRAENLRYAAISIHQLPGTQVIAAAPLYETDPVDCPPDSQPFYNSVIEIHTTLDLHDLLQNLREIEANLGRPNRHDHNAPRTVDLDILCAGDQQLYTPELTLPHPRMTQRAFVLQPLADLHPDLILPGHDDTVCSLLADLDTPESPLLLVDEYWI